MSKAAMNQPRYKAYPEYKDSGVEWLGEVPFSWNSIPLKLVITTRKGVAFKSSDFTDKGIRVVKASDIKNLSVNLSDVFLMEKFFGLYPKAILRERDIVLSTVGSTPDVKNSAVGQIGIIPAELDGTLLNQNTVVFDPDKNKIKHSYLFHILQMTGYRDHLDLHAHGTANQASLSISDMLDFQSPLPSIEEQTQIANYLDHETAKIDTLIDKQQQLISLLKEKRQAVISHAVTRGLNPDAPMKDSGVEWLGEVPAHWIVVKLKHIISELESGCSVNASDIPAQENEIGVLKTSCVYTRSFRVNENKTVIREDLTRVKCPIRKDAIIISRMNTPELVGASAIVDIEKDNIYLPDRLWQTVFDSSISINSKFLSFFMMIEGFRNQISLAAEGASSSMQNIAKGDYLAINTLLPPIAEQNSVVIELERRLCKFSDLVNNADLTVTLLQERRTALISAAVTGKIDVRHFTLENGQAPISNQEEALEAIA